MIQEDGWNRVELGFRNIRTYIGSVVGKIACVGICERNGDGEA